MASELSELDELIESDVLEALGEKVAEDSSVEIEGITIEDIEIPTTEAEDTLAPIENETPSEEETDENIDSSESKLENTEDLGEVQIEDIEDSEQEDEQSISKTNSMATVNTTDLASLLSELLNNKTIEITIKVKD